MAANSIRLNVKRALLTQLATNLPDVTVTYGVPKDPAFLAIAGGDVSGTSEPHAMRQGRKVRQERFTIDLLLRVSSQAIEAGYDGGDVVDANPLEWALDNAVLDLYYAVEDIVADDPTLGNLAGLQSATVGQIDGPGYDPDIAGGTSGMRVSIECLSRLT